MSIQGLGALRTIIGLTAAYVVIIAVLMFYTSDPGSKVSGMLVGEVLFAIPMLIALALSRWMVSVEARRVIAGFQVGYTVITLVTFYSTFTGEHDAQYQLALLLIPFFGFLGVAGAGLIAAFLRH